MECFASLLLLLLVMGLTGCKVDSIHPISAIDATQPDAALHGLWRYKAKGDLVYVHIGPEFALSTGGAAAGPAKGTRIIVIDHKQNGITDEAYVAYPSRIGKQRYLNVVQVEGNKTVGFIFVQYALIDKNTVRFSTMNAGSVESRDRQRSDQRRNSRRGTRVGNRDDVRVGRYRGVLGRYGGKLFTQPFVLHRVR